MRRRQAGSRGGGACGAKLYGVSSAVENRNRQTSASSPCGARHRRIRGSNHGLCASGRTQPPRSGLDRTQRRRYRDRLIVDRGRLLAELRRRRARHVHAERWRNFRWTALLDLLTQSIEPLHSSSAVGCAVRAISRSRSTLLAISRCIPVWRWASDNRSQVCFEISSSWQIIVVSCAIFSASARPAKCCCARLALRPCERFWKLVAKVA